VHAAIYTVYSHQWTSGHVIQCTRLSANDSGNGKTGCHTLVRCWLVGAADLTSRAWANDQAAHIISTLDACNTAVDGQYHWSIGHKRGSRSVVRHEDCACILLVGEGPLIVGGCCGDRFALAFSVACRQGCGVHCGPQGRAGWLSR